LKGLDWLERNQRQIDHKPRDNEMMGREIMREYHRLNSQHRGAFHRWLMANTVVGALALFALIAAASVYSWDSSNTAATPKQKVTLHSETR
jgi:hypothetical protein